MWFAALQSCNWLGNSLAPWYFLHPFWSLAFIENGGQHSCGRNLRHFLLMLDFYQPIFWAWSPCSLCLLFESACIVNTPVAMTTPQAALISHLVAGSMNWRSIRCHFDCFELTLDVWLVNLLIELLHGHLRLLTTKCRRCSSPFGVTITPYGLTQPVLSIPFCIEMLLIA